MRKLLLFFVILSLAFIGITGKAQTGTAYSVDSLKQRIIDSIYTDGQPFSWTRQVTGNIMLDMTETFDSLYKEVKVGSIIADSIQQVRKELVYLPTVTNPNSFLVNERKVPFLNFPPDTNTHISLYVAKMAKVGDSIMIDAKADRTRQVYGFVYDSLGQLDITDTARYVKVTIPKQIDVSGLERTRDPVLYYDSSTEVGQVYFKGYINIYRDTFTRADAFNYYPTNSELPVYDTADARLDFGISGDRNFTDLSPASYIKYKDSSYLFVTMGMDNPQEYWIVMLSSVDDINWKGRRIIAYPKMPYNQVLGPVVFRLKNAINDDSTWYFSYPTSSEQMGDKTFSVISYAESLYGQVYHLEGSMFYPSWDSSVFTNTRNYMTSILMKPDVNGYNPYVFPDGHWLVAVSGTKSDGVTSERAGLAEVYPVDYGKKDINADSITTYKVTARVIGVDSIEGAALNYLDNKYQAVNTAVLIGGNNLSDMGVGITQQGKYHVDINGSTHFSLLQSSSTLTVAFNESYKTMYWNFYGNSASSLNILNATPSTGSGSEAAPALYFYQRNTADNSWLDYARIIPTYTGDGSSKAGGYLFYSRAGGGWSLPMDVFSRVQIYTGLVLGNTQYSRNSTPPNGSKIYMSESFSNLDRPIYVKNNSASNHALISAEGNVSYAFLETGGSIRGLMKYDFVANEIYWSNIEYDGGGGKHIGLDYLNVFRHRNAAGTTLFSNDVNGNTYTLGNMTIGNIPDGNTSDSLLVSDGGVIKKINALLRASAALDFPSTAANGQSDLTIAVSGAVVGDVVSIGVPNASTTIGTYVAWVSASDVITIRYHNTSSGSNDPASGTFKVIVFK